MQKIDQSPASANRVRLGHWRTACRERPRRTPEPRRPAGAGALPRQTAAGGSTDLGSGDPPATTQTASVELESPVPSGARERATDPARLWPQSRKRESRVKNQNSEAQNVVKQTTPSTHPSTPSEFKQMRSGLLHATKPGRRKFKNHLLCQSRFNVTACRVDVFPASLIYTDVERPCSSK